MVFGPHPGYPGKLAARQKTQSLIDTRKNTQRKNTQRNMCPTGRGGIYATGTLRFETGRGGPKNLEKKN